MPNAPRPDKKMAKLAYKILHTPKDLQQFGRDKPTEKQKEAWYIDSVTSQ